MGSKERILVTAQFPRTSLFQLLQFSYYFQAKGQVSEDDETPDMDIEAVKNLPDKLNSETEKEVQKKIEDMFAD
ncbi:jg2216 [Pararge aegeria aegeria]|uniref:Jg2216 protein n=1 Tax=Pararge aegeria aegeria TaxID=348720 RepID=A0A8S4QK17_9NEOP|nr:jg2216 [Pararge aegeria aegeria]